MWQILSDLMPTIWTQRAVLITGMTAASVYTCFMVARYYTEYRVAMRGVWLSVHRSFDDDGNMYATSVRAASSLGEADLGVSLPWHMELTDNRLRYWCYTIHEIENNVQTLRVRQFQTMQSRCVWLIMACLLFLSITSFMYSFVV